LIVLHAATAAGRLLVWGEASEPPRQSRKGRRSRPDPISSRAALLPHDAGEDLLRHALASATVLTRTGLARPFTAWLPTRNGAALPSSVLVSDDAEPDTRAPAKPWTVTAIPLPPGHAIALLRAAAEKPLIAAGVAGGDDLRFFCGVLRFAAGLVASGHFVPSIARDSSGFHAPWVPFLQGDTSRTFMRLAQAAPRAALALTTANGQGPPDVPRTPRPPNETLALAAFVEAMVDSLVRQAALPVPPTETASAHEHWVAALRSPDDTLLGTEASLEALAAQVRSWQRPVVGTASAPFRLTVRLEEPAEVPGQERDAGPSAQEEPWHLRFLLQSNADPSLLIPAAQAWQRGALLARLLPEAGFGVREHLLLSLGRAAAVFPRIEASLHGTAPAGLDLDTRGAHEFLTQGAGALEQAGFGVLLPSWWTRGGPRVRLTVSGVARPPRMKSKSGLSLDALTRFDLEVSLGGAKLTHEELLALAAAKEPLVRFRGHWVHVTAEEVRAALAVWRRKGGPLTARQVIGLALGAPSELGPLPLDGVATSGWLEDLLKQLKGEAPMESLAPPEGFAGTLRPYQERGMSWLHFLGRWGFGACLADDMGLGKTVQALALVQHLRETGHGGPVLLVCPTSVIANWQHEATRFTPDLRVLVHHGGRRVRGGDFKSLVAAHDIVISSYALLNRDLAHLGEVEWTGVILDEAQNVKNSETRQARAARSLTALWRIALTGTPVENHVGDLWSLFEFLNPGLLGGAAEFKREFFVPIQARQDGAAEVRLRHLTGPFILRRLKTDKGIAPDLPDKMEMNVFCNLTREQATLYAAVVKEATDDIGAAKEEIERRGRVLAALSRLKQVCNHPAQFLADHSPLPGRSGKLARLTEMLEEVLEVGERALVFTQFAVMGGMLRKHLQETFGREVLFLHGGVPRGQRDRMVQRFQEDEDAPPIFVLSLKAGGTGLNLQRASHVFHFDRWWNPAVEDQATDRAFRIGQTRRVQVHKLVCAGTLEERIDEMIAKKRGLAARIVGEGEGWLTELSLDQLRFVMALRPEAVAE
jgi:SNF2-related domain/SNF2 Helicase protein/Helicase conserved C-terminal domain